MFFFWIKSNYFYEAKSCFLFFPTFISLVYMWIYLFASTLVRSVFYEPKTISYSLFLFLFFLRYIYIYIAFYKVFVLIFFGGFFLGLFYRRSEIICVPVMLSLVAVSLFSWYLRYNEEENLRVIVRYLAIFSKLKGKLPIFFPLFSFFWSEGQRYRNDIAMI